MSRPTVEEANAIAPSHSRIFKEVCMSEVISNTQHLQDLKMILVSSPAKPFAFTAKGTPRRHIILADYANEIDAAYAHLEESSGEDIPLSHLSSVMESLCFVRTVVTKVMRRTPADDDDLFQNGCDR